MFWKVFVPSILLLFFLSACGTPAQPTQAPPPTEMPTAVPPTEIPFNLNIQVSDALGAPVGGATLQIDNSTETTELDGSAKFTNLTTDKVTISVAANGYKNSSLPKTLARGDNLAEVRLEEDPNGLLPVNACAPGEKLLYLDDFQDRLAQQWDVFENKANGWSIVADPENPDDLVMAAQPGAPWAWLGRNEAINFENVVWRLRYKYNGNGSGQINFRFVESPSIVRRYIVGVNPDGVRSARFQPDQHLDIGQVGRPLPGQWHLLEMSYFNGEFSVFVDGNKGTSWIDPKPWPGGTINLEPNLGTDSVFYYNNITVCELAAPFAPIPKPKTGINLSVTLNDVEGKPISSASISLVEMGSADGAVQVTGQDGKSAWLDLGGKNATLQIKAPGYTGKTELVSLEKGENVASYTLERDPAGKLASELCRQEETLKYSEDLQTGALSGWDELQQKIDLNIPGMAIIDDPAIPGNKILAFTGQNDGEHAEAGMANNIFGDVVLRYNFLLNGDIHQLLAWHMADDNSQRYMAFIYGSKQNGGRLEKVTSEGGGPGQNVQIAQWSKYTGDGKWHLAEISFYQGEVQLWMDGKKLMKWSDPKSTPEGRFGLAHDFWKSTGFAYYDNFAVCNLSAPFVSIQEK